MSLNLYRVNVHTLYGLLTVARFAESEEKAIEIAQEEIRNELMCAKINTEMIVEGTATDDLLQLLSLWELQILRHLRRDEVA